MVEKDVEKYKAYRKAMEKDKFSIIEKVKYFDFLKEDLEICKTEIKRKQERNIELRKTLATFYKILSTQLGFIEEYENDLKQKNNKIKKK